MNSILKIKRLTYAVIILSLLNIGILAWMWLHKPPHHPNAARYVEQELNLDKEQREQYIQLRNSHQATFQKLRNQVAEERKQIMLLVGKDDSVQLNQHYQAVAQFCIQQEQNTYQHFLDVFRICTPAQQEKFYQIAPNIPDKLNPPKR